MSDKFYLITYSQNGSNGNVLPDNIVIRGQSPAAWLREMVDEYPDDSTLLLFAMEIDEMGYNALVGEI